MKQFHSLTDLFSPNLNKPISNIIRQKTNKQNYQISQNKRHKLYPFCKTMTISSLTSFRSHMNIILFTIRTLIYLFSFGINSKFLFIILTNIITILQPIQNQSVKKFQIHKHSKMIKIRFFSIPYSGSIFFSPCYYCYYYY